MSMKTIKEFIKNHHLYQALNEIDEIINSKNKSEIESLILSDISFCYYYTVTHKRKRRWKLAEKLFSEDAQFAYRYAQDVIKGKWELGEKIISQSAENSFFYARDMNGRKRWEPGEDVISKSPEYSYLYAQQIIKDRWEKGEMAISKSSKYSYLYAENVLNGRFELGERKILTSKKASLNYAFSIINGRWEDYEKKILSEKEVNSSDILDYCERIERRWPEAEKHLDHGDKLEYYEMLNLPLPEEVYNRELMNAAVSGYTSCHLDELLKKKKFIKEYINQLINEQTLSKEDKIENLLAKL